MGSAAWRILGPGSAIVAGLLAGKIVDILWEKAGNDRGIDPNNPEVPMSKALIYAAATGLAVGLARTFATRKAAQFYEKSAGHLPEDLMPSED